MQNKRVALVTGANKGIGLQIAKDLARQNLTVLVGSRHLENGEDCKSRIVRSLCRSTVSKRDRMMHHTNGLVGLQNWLDCIGCECAGSPDLVAQIGARAPFFRDLLEFPGPISNDVLVLDEIAADFAENRRHHVGVDVNNERPLALELGAVTIAVARQC